MTVISTEYRNPLMVELMVPRDPNVAARTQSFYQEIGWVATQDTESEFLTYVHPVVEQGTPPTVAYWQTPNAAKTDFFEHNDTPNPSAYASGLRLPQLQQLVEVCLVVPTDEDVERLYTLGGSLLEDHSHIPLREHAGRNEFRFADPFNYSLRVTADPGWEISAPKSKEEPTPEIIVPEFVTFISSSDGQPRPVVTRHNLRAFSDRVRGNPSLGERTYNSLQRDARDYLTDYIVQDEYGEFIGLKPHRLKEMVAFIDKARKHEEIYLRNYGTKSGDLLRDLHTALYTGQIDEHGEAVKPQNLD